MDSGLGLSVSAGFDVENRPRHVIRSILPDGPAARSGQLNPGDELVEVNTKVLLGRAHQEVVDILRDLPKTVILVLARIKQREEEIEPAPKLPENGPIATNDYEVMNLEEEIHEIVEVDGSSEVEEVVEIIEEEVEVTHDFSDEIVVEEEIVEVYEEVEQDDSVMDSEIENEEIAEIREMERINESNKIQDQVLSTEILAIANENDGLRSVPNGEILNLRDISGSQISYESADSDVSPQKQHTGNYETEDNFSEPPIENPNFGYPESEAPHSEAPHSEAPHSEAPNSEAPHSEAPHSEPPTISEAPTASHSVSNILPYISSADLASAESPQLIIEQELARKHQNSGQNQPVAARRTNSGSAKDRSLSTADISLGRSPLTHVFDSVENFIFECS